MGVITDAVEGLEKGLESKHPELQKVTTTLVETVNTMLLPLAALNAGHKKIKQYFKNDFKKEFNEKTKDIPLEHQKEPKHNIARAAINGIADTLDQPALKDAFLNTLAKSVDNQNDDSLYPAYLSIIQELGSQGLACFVQFVTKYKQTSPYYPPFYSVKTGKIEFSHLLQTSDTLAIPRKAMLENWVRLGLITMSPKLEKSQVVAKGWITEKINKINEPPHQSLILSELRLTDFAVAFIETVAD